MLFSLRQIQPSGMAGVLGIAVPIMVMHPGMKTMDMLRRFPKTLTCTTVGILGMEITSSHSNSSSSKWDIVERIAL